MQVLLAACHELVGNYNRLPELLCDGLMQDCSNSIANALELLQSCTKPSTQYLLIHAPYTRVVVF